MNKNNLYKINQNVRCVKCNHIGAIQFYGNYFPQGLGDEYIDSLGDISKPIMEKYRKTPYMSHAIGFGGTIPWECTNCRNIGLIDFGGLEGYKMGFVTIE